MTTLDHRPNTLELLCTRDGLRTSAIAAAVIAAFFTPTLLGVIA